MHDRRPTTLVNSRRVLERLLRRFWQVLTTFCPFSGVNDQVILIESISIPKNSIFWHECKIGFFMFIYVYLSLCFFMPKFCKRYMTVSRLMWASRIVWLKINISSKYIITLILIFLRREIGIFNNFVNTLGAGPSPKHRHMNSYESPSTEILRTSSSFDLMGHWKMHPSGPVCTSNLPPVWCTLTEKGLPFWNGEKEWTGSTFSDLSQDDSLRLFSPQGISCSKTPLGQVELPLLSLSSTSPLIPHRQEQFASCSSS